MAKYSIIGKACAVLLCTAVSQAAVAAVMSTSTVIGEFSGSGNGKTVPVSLSQFDDSLGVLTGIAFTVDIEGYSATLSLGDYDSPGVEEYSFDFADLSGQISLDVPTGSGGGLLFATEGFGGTIDDESGSTAVDPSLAFNTDDATARLIGAGLFNNFIGDDIVDLNFGIFTFYQGARVHLFDDSGAPIEVAGTPYLDSFSLGPSTIGIDYTYSPVPVPAAVWLFGSGLVGLFGLAKRKKNKLA